MTTDHKTITELEREALDAFVSEFPSLREACRFMATTLVRASRDGWIPACALRCSEHEGTVEDHLRTWEWLRGVRVRLLANVVRR